MNSKQQLKLLNDLWLDIQHPDFVWQALALLACMLTAYFVARWWRRHESGKAGRLHAAGTRVAFPLLALVLVSSAYAVLEGNLQVHLLEVAIPLFASMAIVRFTVYVLRQSFPNAVWLNASERWVATVVWLGLALYITGLAPAVIGLLDRFALTVGKHPITLWVAIKAAFTVLVTVMLALWLAGAIERRLLRVPTLDASLRMVMVRLAKALLTVIALMTGLTLVGIDMTALSVFTGALGVGLGFGLQKIASNYVSGFIILLDRSIRIGDTIQLAADTRGIVTEITTRYTVLRNLGGAEFIVPNENLIGNVVQNQSYTDSQVRVTVQVGVAYSTADLPGVLTLLQEIAAAQPRVLKNPPPAALITGFGVSAIDLELGFWVSDPQEGTGGLRSAINLAIWNAFRERGISIPFPQREVRLLADPD